MKKCILEKEGILKYYIKELHTRQETADYFGVSIAVLDRFCKANNIYKTVEETHTTHKNAVSERIHKKPSKDIINNYYIVENHSKEECISYFGVSNSTFSRWLQDYNIKKPADKKKARFVIGQSYKKKPVPSIDELEQVYINTSLKEDEVIKKYNVSLSTFRRWLMDYGVHKNSSQLVETIKQSNINKYGLPNYQQTNIHNIEYWNDEEKFICFIKQNKMTTTELCNFFNIGLTTLWRRIHELNLEEYVQSNSGRSEPEITLGSTINQYQNDLIFNDRNILAGQEIDIYSPTAKIGIEFNGTYWHSMSILNDKNYHYNKSITAQKAGIRLIHIYEYEWNDPIKKPIIESLLKIAFGQVEEKIYARKCVIKEIDNQTAKEFNDLNHLQGHRNAQVTYGLYYNDKLVQLMSFSKTKYNKNLKNDNCWEIIRGCPGSNNIVIGGVSKLFNHFLTQYNPEQVFSYCDFNKFDGKGYEALGMKFVGYTGPDMKWILKDGSVVNRCPSKHDVLKKMSIDNIYGAGSKKYLWTKPE